MKLITISWRDIPSQVLVKAGRTKAKVQLSHRFQAAIDELRCEPKRRSEAYLDAGSGPQTTGRRSAQQSQGATLSSFSSRH